MRESKPNADANPYEPTALENQPATEFNNELLPKPGLRHLLRWTAITGIPILFGVANGIRAFRKTFLESTGSDFIMEASVLSFFGGCIIGAGIGLVVSGVLFVATRRSD